MARTSSDDPYRGPGGRPYLAAWIPVLLFEGLVLYLSSRPNLRLPSGVPYLDKMGHFGEYAALGGLLYRALRFSGGIRRESAVGAILAIALLGAGDEVFQRQIPGRFSSALDWMADFLGGVSGALLAQRMESGWPSLFRFGVRGRVEHGGLERDDAS